MRGFRPCVAPTAAVEFDLATAYPARTLVKTGYYAGGLVTSSATKKMMLYTNYGVAPRNTAGAQIENFTIAGSNSIFSPPGSVDFFYSASNNRVGLFLQSDSIGTTYSPATIAAGMAGETDIEHGVNISQMKFGANAAYINDSDVPTQTGPLNLIPFVNGTGYYYSIAGKPSTYDMDKHPALSSAWVSLPGYSPETPGEPRTDCRAENPLGAFTCQRCGRPI